MRALKRLINEALGAFDEFVDWIMKTEQVPHRYSSRGFKQMEPIMTDYGHEVRVFESSNAKGPCIWLAIERSTTSPTMDDTEPRSAHLTLEDAKLIRDQLDWLIHNHYQVQDPEMTWN